MHQGSSFQCPTMHTPPSVSSKTLAFNGAGSSPARGYLNTVSLVATYVREGLWTWVMVRLESRAAVEQGIGGQGGKPCGPTAWAQKHISGTVLIEGLDVCPQPLQPRLKHLDRVVSLF